MTGGSESVAIDQPILVVDDEPVVIRLLAELFEGRAVRLISRENGEEAIEILKTTEISCLLVDKNLPGIDGLEVLRVARAEQPRCACILMTAFSSTDSAVQALRLGANDYLKKPFEDLQLVAEKVDHAIRNQRARFERNLLSERVRQYAAQMAQMDAVAVKRRSESELFEMVLHARIREATDDLRRKAKILSATVAAEQKKVARARQMAQELHTAVESLDLAETESQRLSAQVKDLTAVLATEPTE